MKTKYMIRDIQSTNVLVKKLKKKETMLIINLGNGRTELPSQRENIIEVDMMMEDWNKIGALFDHKIILIKHLLENSKDFNYVIVRCDAGASRSQAIGTLFGRILEIDFDRNILIGNHTILIEADKVIRKWKFENDETYKAVFK